MNDSFRKILIAKVNWIYAILLCESLKNQDYSIVSYAKIFIPVSAYNIFLYFMRPNYT